MKYIIFFALLIFSLSPIACSDEQPKIVLPSITTAPSSSITPLSASSGGNVTSGGHGEVSSRGIIWSKNPQPVFTLTTKTSDGTGTGTFISELTNLDPNTVYYVRAYAINEAGVAYGEQVEFQTSQLTVTDADNNTYATVKIGNQIWMAENLKTTKYNDGTPIPLNTVTSADIETAAYSWYNNDEVTYKNGYGAMYNFYAVETGKVCPTGWHVPTINEVYVLRDFVGPGSGSLKEQGITHWKSPNTGATNSTGFTALPAGTKTPSFSFLGEYTFWWTSSSGAIFGMDYQSTSFYNQYGAYNVGLSVRCLKN